MEIRDVNTGSMDYEGHTIYFPVGEECNYITYKGFTYFYNDSYLLHLSDNRVKGKYLKQVTRLVYRDIENNEIWQIAEPLPYPDGLYRQSARLVNLTRVIKHTMLDGEIDLKEIKDVKDLFKYKKIHGIDRHTHIDNIRNVLQDTLFVLEFILYIVFALCLSFGIICITHQPVMQIIWFLPCFIGFSVAICLGLHNLLKYFNPLV